MQTYFERKPVQILTSLVFISIILALGAYAYYTLERAAEGPIGPTTISVTGEGEIFATPDIGQFSFSVNAEGETAAEAQQASAESTNAILEYLAEQGVEERDIKTTNYNLYPRYEYPQQICPAGSFCPPGERQLVGYEVNQTVTVKVRDLDTAGDLISGVGDRGATNISNLSFTIDDDSALKAEARDQAIQNAQAEARSIADSLGVRLVRMTGYYEQQHPPMPYGYGGEMMEQRAMDDGAMSAPSMPAGESTITSQVTIMYEIK